MAGGKELVADVAVAAPGLEAEDLEELEGFEELAFLDFFLPVWERAVSSEFTKKKKAAIE